MPIRTEIDHGTSMIRTYISGRVDGDAVVAYSAEVRSNPDAMLCTGALIDCSELRTSEVKRGTISGRLLGKPTQRQYA